MDGEGSHRWLTAHLFYHGSLDLLLRECVLPLVRELRSRDLLDRYFFLRYWLGGPHVRLRLLPADDRAAADVRAAVVRHGDRFFAAQPSMDGLTAHAYAQLAETLTRMEPDAADLPLQPNNSVQFAGYRPEHHKYGTSAALAAVEWHFEQSSDLALEVVSHELPAGRRQMLALAALLAGVDATDGTARFDRLATRLGRGQRAWGATIGVPGARYAQVAAAYAQRRDQLRTVALRVSRPEEPTGEAFVDGWRDSVRHLWTVLTDLERLGTFPAGERAGFSATGFAVENCQHMLFNRLGIPLSDEWLLRGLAACAAADLRDESRSGVG